MNIKEIAQSDPRIDALICTYTTMSRSNNLLESVMCNVFYSFLQSTVAAEDYCADTGLVRTPSRLEMLFARQTVVTAAIAYGLQAIDLVCVDFQDEKTLREECDEGRTFGFTGKQAIHPKQIDIIQALFMPAEKGGCGIMGLLGVLLVYSSKSEIQSVHRVKGVFYLETPILIQAINNSQFTL